jgi:hypothetical protein
VRTPDRAGITFGGCGEREHQEEGRGLVSLTPPAANAQRVGDVPVLDRHRIAICCAAAGDASLHVTPRAHLGVGRFSSDLPSDFGLRAVLGRLPDPPVKEEVP